MKKLFLILLIVPFLSCGIKDEKTTKAEKSFKEVISKIEYGKLKVLDFNKVNGIERDMWGTKYYTLEFESKVEAITDVSFYDDYYNTWKRFFSIYDINDIRKNKQKKFRNIDLVRFKAGDTFKVSGKINFIKKENGWEITK